MKSRVVWEQTRIRVVWERINLVSLHLHNCIYIIYDIHGLDIHENHLGAYVKIQILDSESAGWGLCACVLNTSLLLNYILSFFTAIIIFIYTFIT